VFSIVVPVAIVDLSFPRLKAEPHCAPAESLLGQSLWCSAWE
jgi:hypothetical protein